MTSSSELLALAVRCEHEEPSRELDADIERAVRGMRANQMYPPPRTSSIDSAVTLVPKDFDHTMTWYRKTADAYVSRDGGEFKPDDCVGQATASTLALALCAAALRARAAEAGKEET